MAYDEDLAGRIRELVSEEPDLTEQKMFGGLAFLIGGNMAVAASGQGGVLVRLARWFQARALPFMLDGYEPGEAWKREDDRERSTWRSEHGSISIRRDPFAIELRDGGDRYVARLQKVEAMERSAYD
jgi:hypothetical protein